MQDKKVQKEEAQGEKIPDGVDSFIRGATVKKFLRTNKPKERKRERLRWDSERCKIDKL